MCRQVWGTAAGETGGTAVEYALFVLAIALIMIFGAFFLGSTNPRTDDGGACQDAGPGVSCPSSTPAP